MGQNATGMYIAVNCHLVSRKITGDEFIGALLPVGDDQFIAHLTVIAATSRAIAKQDIAGAVSEAPGSSAQSGIVFTGLIVPKGLEAQPSVFAARVVFL